LSFDFRFGALLLDFTRATVSSDKIGGCCRVEILSFEGMAEGYLLRDSIRSKPAS
jgi:hypothetical protein